jgi:hypothetical protein
MNSAGYESLKIVRAVFGPTGGRSGIKVLWTSPNAHDHGSCGKMACTFASFPEHADRLLTKQPANPMQPAHHAFFNQTGCASDLPKQVGPQP